MFTKYILLAGIILLFIGGFSPAVKIFEYASAQVANKVPSLSENLTPDQSRAYDMEMAKRIIDYKRLRERHRKRQFFEAREGLFRNENYIQNILKRNLWDKKPYGPVGRFKFYSGKKHNFGEPTHENGVFKLKNTNYYLWSENENDYDDIKTAGGEIEIEDPLKNLSSEERREKLRLVCQKEKYNEPYKDPKVIEFLKSVYYTFLEKSKSSNYSKGGGDEFKNKTNKNYAVKYKNEIEKTITYSSKFTDLHIYIGVLERTPTLLQDHIFPPFITPECDQKLVDFYYDKVAISKEEGLDIFSKSYFPTALTSHDNPKSTRLNEANFNSLIIQLRKVSEFSDKKRAISKIISSSYTNVVRKEIINKAAMNEFTLKTGCLVHITGNVVNPNAPYISYHPHGITYCKGEVYLIKIVSPFIGRRMNATSVLNKLNYIGQISDKYFIKKTHFLFTEIQTGLAVLKLRKCLYVIYTLFDSQVTIIDVDFDDINMLKFAAKLNEVYFNHALPEIYRLSQL